MLIAHALLVLGLSATQAVKPSASISFPPIPDGCKIQIELHTAGENLARVTFTIKGKTTTEVRDLALKELARHHWAVEGIGPAGVRVRGFQPKEGELEPIVGITITTYTNDLRTVPPFVSVGHSEGIRAKVLIQMHPGPFAEEKP